MIGSGAAAPLITPLQLLPTLMMRLMCEGDNDESQTLQASNRDFPFD
jgi:hypothetical protein